MMIDKDTRILIVGLGVIGGSYAIALSRAVGLFYATQFSCHNGTTF